MVGRTRPGIDVPLVVIREGQERSLSIRLGELPEEPRTAQAIAEPPSRNRLGLRVAPLPAEAQKNGEQGVLVQEAGEGPAATAGIRSGDIITRINNTAVSDPAQFAELVKQLPVGRPVPVLVKRDNGALFLALTVPVGDAK